MTVSLTTIFEGKEIRVVDYAGSVWVPCKDISLAFGLNRTTCYKHITRDREFFGDSAIDGDKMSTDGDDIWVNEQGLYLLLARLSLGKVDPKIKLAIQKFRKNVPELVQKFRKGEVQQVPPAPAFELDEVVTFALQEAKEIAALTGTDPKPLYAAWLRNHGYLEFADAICPAPLAVVHGEPGWYNPTELVALCKDPDLTAERLNKWLENYREDGEWRPFQYRDGRLWRLTKRGMEHGREYQYNLGNGHSEPRISWRASVLYACGLKRDLAPDQVMLPQKSQY